MAFSVRADERIEAIFIGEVKRSEVTEELLDIVPIKWTAAGNYLFWWIGKYHCL